MAKTRQLRPVAKAEVDAGNVVTVDGLVGTLHVGIRFEHPYLREPLARYLQEHPDSALACELYLAGVRSRNPADGHGFIRIFGNTIHIPWTNWSAKDGGAEDAPEGEHYHELSKESAQQLYSVVHEAHFLHLVEALRELSLAAQTAWWVNEGGISIVANFVSDRAAELDVYKPEDDPPMVAGLRDWVADVLKRTTIRINQNFPV